MSKSKDVDAAPLHGIVHTPGPWQSKIFDNGAYIIADGPIDELSSCIIASRNAHPDPPTGKANAALIADAPLLLEALRELHDFAEPSQHYRDNERSKAAFVKAIQFLNKHGG